MIWQSRGITRALRRLRGGHGHVLRQERRRGEVLLPVERAAGDGLRFCACAELVHARLPRKPGRRGEGVLVVLVFGLDLEDQGERFGVQPGGWEDVCAALALEEEGEPEREGGAARGLERFGWALEISQHQLDHIYEALVQNILSLWDL